uniref:Uncharacterized protein n=1 Tax=Romanomermis culicivorax TaxID=13658 RepID=A0A915JQ65_ROMCU
MPVVLCGIDMPIVSSSKRHKRQTTIDVVEHQINDDYFALPAADFGRITFDFTSPMAELRGNKGATAVELGAEDAFSTHTSSLLRALVGEEVTDEKLKALHIAHPRDITMREDLAPTGDFGFPLEEAFPADERALEDLEALLALPPSQQIITTEIMDRTAPREATIELAPAERMERTTVGPVAQRMTLEEPAAPTKRARLEQVDQVDVTAAVAPPAPEPQPEMVEVAIALTPVPSEAIKAKRRISAVRRKKIILDGKIKYTPEEFSAQIRHTEDTLLPDDQIIVNVKANERELDKKRHFWRQPAFTMAKSLMEIFRANTEPVEAEPYDINRIFTTPPWTVYSEKSVSVTF